MTSHEGTKPFSAGHLYENPLFLKAPKGIHGTLVRNVEPLSDILSGHNWDFKQ